MQEIFANADIREIEISVPEGHQHLRAVLRMQDGRDLVLQEATVANLVRAYVSIKTHPQISSSVLVGKSLDPAERKAGFAEWQLLE